MKSYGHCRSSRPEWGSGRILKRVSDRACGWHFAAMLTLGVTHIATRATRLLRATTLRKGKLSQDTAHPTHPWIHSLNSMDKSNPKVSPLKCLFPKITWNAPRRTRQALIPNHSPTFDLTDHIQIDDTSYVERYSFAYSSPGQPTALSKGSILRSESIIVHTSLIGSTVVHGQLSGCTVINSALCCGAVVLGGAIEHSRLCGGRYDHCDIRGSMLVNCEVSPGVSVEGCHSRGKRMRRDFRMVSEDEKKRRPMEAYFDTHEMGRRKRKRFGLG